MKRQPFIMSGSLPDSLAVFENQLGFPVDLDRPVMLIHHVCVVCGLGESRKLIVGIADASLAVIQDLCPAVRHGTRDDTVDKSDAVAAQTRDTGKTRGIAVAGASFAGEQLDRIVADRGVGFGIVEINALIVVIVNDLAEARLHFVFQRFAGAFCHQITGGEADLPRGDAYAVFVGIGKALCFGADDPAFGERGIGVEPVLTFFDRIVAGDEFAAFESEARAADRIAAVSGSAVAVIDIIAFGRGDAVAVGVEPRDAVGIGDARLGCGIGIDGF